MGAPLIACRSDRHTVYRRCLQVSAAFQHLGNILRPFIKIVPTRVLPKLVETAINFEETAAVSFMDYFFGGYLGDFHDAKFNLNTIIEYVTHGTRPNLLELDTVVSIVPTNDS